MKNLFGVMPGIVYGWPKNVLHFSGIPNSILDINATVRPTLAIVDGIVGMDGDGPIMGNPKPVGAVVMGSNFAAVDATCVRFDGIESAWRGVSDTRFRAVRSDFGAEYHSNGGADLSFADWISRFSICRIWRRFEVRNSRPGGSFSKCFLLKH